MNKTCITIVAFLTGFIFWIVVYGLLVEFINVVSNFNFLSVPFAAWSVPVLTYCLIIWPILKVKTVGKKEVKT